LSCDLALLRHAGFSRAKIRISRGQKQIYLHFAEATYLRQSQRYE